MPKITCFIDIRTTIHQLIKTAMEKLYCKGSVVNKTRSGGEIDFQV